MTATETYRERLAAAIADKYGSHLQFLKASGVYPSTLYHYLDARIEAAGREMEEPAHAGN